jgi:hypothetical protein
MYIYDLNHLNIKNGFTEMFRILKYIILCKQNFDYIQDTRVIYNTSSLQHCHASRHVMPSKVNAAYLTVISCTHGVQ